MKKQVIVMLSILSIAILLLVSCTQIGGAIKAGNKPFQVELAPAPAPGVSCDKLQRDCGFVSEKRKCAYVEFPFSGDWSGLTYNEICARNNAKSCTAVDVTEISYIHEGPDCTGATRWRDANNIFHPEMCNGVYDPLLRNEQCNNGGMMPPDNPEYYASKTDFIHLRGVLCCT